MENLGTRIGTTDVIITNRIQEIEERILGIEVTIEEMDTLVKKKLNLKKFLTKFQEIWDTMKRPNLRIIGIEGQDSQIKGTENIFPVIPYGIFVFPL